MRRLLASTEGRKRALVALVATPLALALALGAGLGALAESQGWSPLILLGAVLVAAAATIFAGKRMLAAAQSIRRRQKTDWIQEKLRPLRLEVSAAEPRRVDILHPAIDLKHFFGGFIAVFNLARALAERGHRVRLIATERSDLPPDWRNRIGSYEGLGDGALERIDVVFAHDRAPLPINPKDILIATHWTVAHIAATAVARLEEQRFVYIIQEYEPFIFPMGSAAALAHGSYELPHRAVFSTGLLRDYFAAHRIGVFAASNESRHDSVVLNNAITPVGPVVPEELQREGPRRLLFYARPEEHAQRNLFELGIMAIDQAVATGALDGWEICGVGSVEPSTGPLTLSRSGVQVRMIPRSSQSKYAELLRSCDLGLALMYTPHPSLVPIEMAAAGMVTVTNTFENKNAASLQSISPNIIAAKPTVEGIATALATAAIRTDDLAARAAGSSLDWPSSWENALGEHLMNKLDAWLR